jgi:hypothetical protein
LVRSDEADEGFVDQRRGLKLVTRAFSSHRR